MKSIATPYLSVLEESEHLQRQSLEALLILGPSQVLYLHCSESGTYIIQYCMKSDGMNRSHIHTKLLYTEMQKLASKNGAKECICRGEVSQCDQ